MKFITAIILTSLLSYVVGLFTSLPWFSFAIVAFIVALAIHQKPFKAFTAGFLALFLLWGIMAFIIDVSNEHILSTKVADILMLHANNYLLILITALVGALVAGFASLTGSLLRKVK